MIGIDIPMPESCFKCPMASGTYCILTCRQLDESYFYDKRNEYCPLIDLQKPPEAVEAEKTIERMRENLNRIREVLKVLNE